jgi:hypothetical protein
MNIAVLLHKLRRAANAPTRAGAECRLRPGHQEGIREL